MSKNETPIVKEPKTIKVRTVVISLIVAAAIAASFVAGWNFRSYDQARVQAEAASLVKNLK